MNWTETEIVKLQWKIETGGRSLWSFFNGFAKLSIMNKTEIPRPK